MLKLKYFFEKCFEVVNYYFIIDDGYRIILVCFGVFRIQVRIWVVFYEKYGEKGLIFKFKGVSVDLELCIKVVKVVIEQYMFFNQVVVYFMFVGSGFVVRWLKVYEECGEVGLRVFKIGIKRNIVILVDLEKVVLVLELLKD